jgi:hypothetical protein
VDELDVTKLTRGLEELGREKPVALAMVALTVGVAAGLLIARGAEPK